ncbi:MAG: hypothetical protein Q8L07_09345 [Sediminibacterium sp.]|nr:hypothetical protein [Sediminibacterium sp.]MDP3666611.1 hypothetical protein [Sediminibacterium sp.]
MYTKLFLAGVCFFGGTAFLQAQVPFKKIDTTMKLGKSGYRLTCSNKGTDKNTTSVSPIGFDKAVREFSFDIKGRITKAEVDDVNRDGYPDLVIYVMNNDSIPKGNVIGISSEKNENVAPILFPDIYDDPKLRIGYKGNDTYFLMEGNLMRRFPVYPADSASLTSGTGTLYRQIQYQVIPGDRGGYKFKPLRSYEFTKQ